MKKEFTALHFELTNQCNLRCSHCYNIKYLESKNKDLSTIEVKKVIDQAKKLGVRDIGFSGGEPFMRSDIFEIIEYAKEYPIHILTNGMNLDESKIEKLDRIENLILELRISIDGLFTHKMIRGVKNNKALQNIKLLIKHEYIVSVNTMVTNENIHELKEMYHIFEMIGIDRWRLDFIFYSGNAEKNSLTFDCTNEQLYVLKDLIIKHINEQPSFELDVNKLYRSAILDGAHPIQYNLNSHPCSYQGSLTVRPNGNVSYCPSLEMTHGNILVNEMEEIFADPTWEKILNLKVSNLDNECVQCELLKYCGGGCRADSYYEKNDLYGFSENTCRVMKFYAQEILPLLEFEPYIL